MRIIAVLGLVWAGEYIRWPDVSPARGILRRNWLLRRHFQPSSSRPVAWHILGTDRGPVHFLQLVDLNASMFQDMGYVVQPLDRGLHNIRYNAIRFIFLALLFRIPTITDAILSRN